MKAWVPPQQSRQECRAGTRQARYEMHSRSHDERLPSAQIGVGQAGGSSNSAQRGPDFLQTRLTYATTLPSCEGKSAWRLSSAAPPAEVTSGGVTSDTLGSRAEAWNFADLLGLKGIDDNVFHIERHLDIELEIERYERRAGLQFDRADIDLAVEDPFKGRTALVEGQTGVFRHRIAAGVLGQTALQDQHRLGRTAIVGTHATEYAGGVDLDEPCKHNGRRDTIGADRREPKNLSEQVGRINLGCRGRANIIADATGGIAGNDAVGKDAVGRSASRTGQDPTRRHPRRRPRNCR